MFGLCWLLTIYVQKKTDGQRQMGVLDQFPEGKNTRVH